MAITPEWVSAIGTVAALLAAFYAIHQQGQELELQRDELKAQREELANTVEAQRAMLRTERLHGYLELQMRLVEMAMADPDLQRSTEPAMAQLEGDQWKRAAHINLWVQLIQSRYLNQDVELPLRNIKSEVLVDEFGVRWWQRARSSYFENARNEREIRFAEIMDRACQEMQEHLDE